MQDQYATLKKDYSIINDSNIKYESYIRVLNEMKSCYGFSVDEALSQQVFLSRRNNPTKNYYGKYQVPGGRKNKNELYEKCGQREVFEEIQIEIHELEFIALYEGFRLFLDGKKCMFKCALYFAMIGNQVPKQTETCNNDEWFVVDLKDFGKYDLTDSLREFKSEIIEKINSKFRKNRKNVNKKRKIGEPEKKLERKR
ncbi:NUDIX hydrolase [Gigaspora margarita]|uniref:NUDIX hydrolase n=1 Tax=Gigaspora margarita TaxID=4874 RepID=A0A8H4A9E9_GIGMA|nr:NUDIX hydrolase [Gigaspora margarita]